MLGTSYYGYGLVSHSTQCSTLCFHYHYYIYFIQASSQSHSKLITSLPEFISMSDKYSSAGTHIAVTTATDLSGSKDPYIFPVLH